MVKLTNYWNRPPNAAQQKSIDDFKKFVTPAGMTYQQYLSKKQAPKSPLQNALHGLKRSSVGDQGYEAEQLMNFYTQGAGKSEMDNFFAANTDWFSQDGKRTDHMYSDLDKKSLAWLQNGGIGPGPTAMAMAGRTAPELTTQAQPQPSPQQVAQQPQQITPGTFQSPFTWSAPTGERKQMGMFGNRQNRAPRKFRGTL